MRKEKRQQTSAMIQDNAVDKVLTAGRIWRRKANPADLLLHVKCSAPLTAMLENTYLPRRSFGDHDNGSMLGKIDNDYVCRRPVGDYDDI